MFVPGHIRSVLLHTIHNGAGLGMSVRGHFNADAAPMLTQHDTTLTRNLFYTGVTRGKRLVVLVGQRKALAMAIRNAGSRRRWSKLREWLSPSQRGLGTLVSNSKI